MNWNQHINSTYNKAIKTLNFVKRNTFICSQRYRALAYNSLVRPHLEYASASWDPHYVKHISLLEKVQNNAVIVVYLAYDRHTSVSALKTGLTWPLLETRRRVSRLTEFYKVVVGSSPIPGTCLNRSAVHTRAAVDNKFRNLYCRTDTYKFSFFLRSIRDWNELPVEIRLSPSVNVFNLGLLSFWVGVSSHSSPSSSSHC